MYRVYDVKIRRSDLSKAQKIILKHWNDGDIDAVRCDDSQGKYITYWINPYVYEDLEKIIDEFELVGIQIL